MMEPDSCRFPPSTNVLTGIDPLRETTSLLKPKAHFPAIAVCSARDGATTHDSRQALEITADARCAAATRRPNLIVRAPDHRVVAIEVKLS